MSDQQQERPLLRSSSMQSADSPPQEPPDELPQDIDERENHAIPSPGPPLPRMLVRRYSNEWYRDVNRCTLIGTVTRVGKARTVKNETGPIDVCVIWLLVRENIMRKDGSVLQRAQVHSINVWRFNCALVQKNLSKGDKVYVEGRLSYESWTSKKHGGEVHMTCINCTEIVFLSLKKRPHDYL